MNLLARERDNLAGYKNHAGGIVVSTYGEILWLVGKKSFSKVSQRCVLRAGWQLEINCTRMLVTKPLPTKMLM